MGIKSLTARLLSPRMFNYANNRLTIAGIVLTTISAIVIMVFILVGLGGGLPNPYINILGFMILPALFVFGLLLIPFGMWRRRRLLLKEGLTDEEIGRYPKLDFNNERLRKLATVVLLLTVINAIILGTSSYLAVHYMDGVEFCGTTCHTVMQPEYQAYQQSPHSRVACVQCHIGPGASFFVRSKIDGLIQVWHTVWNTYSRPLETPLKHLRPARETCEQCHWPAKHYGDKIRIFGRFSEDEENTPSYTALLLRTGGGSLDTGRHGGVHWWHIYSDNRIRYLAVDKRRQEIAWVELVTADDETRIYTREGGPEITAEQIESEARVLDCIDCHNRPTHLFKPPAKAFDDILQDYPELVELPYFKREALAALEAEYETHAEGVKAVQAAIESFYRDDYPELTSSRPQLVQQGAETAASVFVRNYVPEMKTNWETHPNNIGHDEFPGCWRCHDDELVTPDGEHTIPQDCDTCHIFLAEDSSTPPDLGAVVFEQP
jgi:nitrate/TMAO reductase-like tetraheme cytochrome c subunit